MAMKAQPSSVELKSHGGSQTHEYSSHDLGSKLLRGITSHMFEFNAKSSSRARRRLRRHRGRALYLFETSNPFRRTLILLAENAWFDRVILIIILVNCIFLAMDDGPPPNSAKSRLLETSDLIFNIIYTLEMVIKIISFGFVSSGPYAYIRSSWNILDFVVVVSGWVNFILSFTKESAGNFSVLRSLRLLRPLKAISSVPGMQIQVKALLSSIPSLLNVLALLTFLLFVFGILGMQLMASKLSYRCVMDSSFLNMAIFFY